MAIFSKGLSHISFIYSGCLSSHLFPFSQCTTSDVFVDVHIHAFPVIMSFDAVKSSVYSLVT